MAPYKPIMMMDSGAWSAYTHQQEINLPAYCDFLHEHMGWIDTYVALDKIIPGDTEEAASQGFANWQYMVSRGLPDAIPVFHQGEDIKWVHKYLDAGATYIGLSATSLAQKQAIDHWYRICWRHLVNQDGYPIVRTHAFGDTRERALRAFPWASCDSSSWIYFAQVYGMIKVNDDTVSHRRQNMTLSQRNDGRVSSSSVMDIDRLSQQERDSLFAMLAKEGIKTDVFTHRISRTTRGRGARHNTPEEREIATRTLLARSMLTIRYYEGMEARTNALVPRRLEVAPHAWGDHESVSTRPVDPAYTKFSLYLAIGGNWMTLPLVRAAQHAPILASYFYLSGGATEAKRLAHVKRFMHDPDTAVREGNAKKYADLLDTIFEDSHARPQTPQASPTLQPAHQQAVADR